MSSLDIKLFILLALLLAISATATFAAPNDPGHDTLYVLRMGDTNITGSINLTGNVTARLVRISDKIFGNYIEVVGNGTTDMGTMGTASRIIGGNNELYIDSPQNLYINTKGGTSNTVQVGPVSGSTIIFNVSGNITQRGVKICLADGTNCPGGSNTGNVSSISAGNGISVTNPNGPTVTVSTSATSCGAGEYSYWDGNSWECRADLNSGGTGNITGPGSANYIPLWTNISNIGSSIMRQSGSSIILSGTNDSSTASSFDVNGALLRIGDQNSALPMGNGVGIKFHDSGIAHASIKFTASTGRIDFGRSSSASTLQFDSATQPAFSILASTAPGAAVNMLASSNQFDVNGTVKMQNLTGTTGLYQSAAANVGIGTVSPAQKLDVSGNIATSGTTRISSTGVGTFATGTTINAQEVCLADGTNCPAVTGDNTSWNEALADTLYLGITATAANSNQLNGQAASYYTDIPSRLGYTPSQAASAADKNSIYSADTRNIDFNASSRDKGLYVDFKTNAADGLSDGGTYHGVLTFRSYGSGIDLSGGYPHQLAFTANNNLHMRIAATNSTWGAWNKFWHSGNDGSGSTLDADLFDGQNSLTFLNTTGFNAGNITSGTLAVARGGTGTTTSSGTGSVVLNNSPIISGTGTIIANTIKVGANNVCQSDGTNCPASAGAGNTTGSGTANTLAYWVNSTHLGSSIISQSGSTLTINGNISLPQEFWIGTGASTSGGTKALAIGYFAEAKTLSTTSIGHQAGQLNTKNYTTSIGASAGYQNAGEGLTAIGANAGSNNNGLGLVAIGNSAGGFNTGNRTTLIGSAAGYQNSGNYSTAIGYQAGYTSTAEGISVFGYQAGMNVKGNFTTAIGYQAGWNNTASNVVAIGYRAGYSNAAPNQFIVKQANINTTPLIQGNFSSGNVGIGTTTPGFKLQVGTGNTAGINANTHMLVTDPDYARMGVAVNGAGIFFGASTDNTKASMFVYDYNAGAARDLILNEYGGNVGIGTTSPVQKLDVVGSINVSGANKLYTPELCLNGDCQTAWPAGGGGNISGSGTTNYITKWSNSTALTSSTIYDDGTAVGIGTATPDAQLHLGGIARPAIALTKTTNINWSIVAGNNNYLYIKPALPDTVSADTDAALTITTAGVVGIGDSTPTNKLDVAGAIGISDTTIIDASRNIVNAGTGAFSGALSATTLNTGNGAYELYAMNQDVETTDAVTFATVNTGNGAMEVNSIAAYLGNQNLRTTDSPTFAAVTATTFTGALSGNAATATSASDLSCTNCIGGTEIDESALAGVNAATLDSIDSASFLRSDADDSLTAAIVVPTANRDEGIFGTYDATLTQHIWSMGTAYRNNATGYNFGNLYGLAYKHTNNPTGGAMAGGHQAVWVQAGTPTAALGTGIWTSGTVTANSFTGAGTGLTGTAASLSIGGNAATASAVDWSGVASKPAFAANAVTGRVRMWEVGCASSYASSCDAGGNGLLDLADAATSATSASDLSCTDCIGATEISDVYLLNSGDTTSGDIIFGTGAQVDFHDEVGDKAYWYTNTYGTGIEASTLTDWSNSQFRWRIGGTSVSTGTEYLLLTTSGLTTPGYLKAGTGTPGYATGNGEIYATADLEYDGNLYGPGADLAELINASEELEAGDVVVADETASETVKRSAQSYSTAVIGVVSSDPGIILSKNQGDIPLALSGRVPVKVSAENGPIRPGDLLTTSSTPGHAMRCESAQACQGAIVAKSLGFLESGTGMVTGLVMLG